MRLAPAPSLTTNDRHTVTHENTLSCRDCQRNCQNCQGPRTEHREIRLKCEIPLQHFQLGAKKKKKKSQRGYGMSEKHLYTRTSTNECTYWGNKGHTGVVLVSRCDCLSSEPLSQHLLQATSAYTPD